MKRVLFGIVLMCVAAVAGAQVYPDEVRGGVCDAPDIGIDEVLVSESVDGPVSVPVDSSIGFDFFLDFNGEVLSALNYGQVNKFGRVVGPPVVLYSSGLNLIWDAQYCHYRFEYLAGGSLFYEIWLAKDGKIEWHSGDWDVDGLFREFGNWHIVSISDPTFLVRKVTAKD